MSETVMENISVLDRNDQLVLPVGRARKILNVWEKLLKMPNALSSQQESRKELRRRIRFGNGRTADLHGLREKLVYDIATIMLLLNINTKGKSAWKG